MYRTIFLFILLPNEQYPQNQEFYYLHEIGTSNLFYILPLLPSDENLSFPIDEDI